MFHTLLSIVRPNRRCDGGGCPIAVAAYALDDAMAYNAIPRSRAASLVQRPVDTVSRVYDLLFARHNLHTVERATVLAAVAGFLLHIGLIFLARTLDDPPAVIASVGPHYLAAIYTPFTFILFYEVLLLILSIPESTTRAIGKQYEIISLIVIRDVFKDIAEFKTFDDFLSQLQEFVVVLLDMGGGLVMFLLVALFYHANSRRVRDSPSDTDLGVFIARKKAIALSLAVLLVALASYSLGEWVLAVYRSALGIAPFAIDIRTTFYTELFTVMIFTDVLILIVSMLHSDRYELVFRNAGFVISTILIRISLTTPKPYNLGLAVAAIAFGILVLLIYNSFGRLPAEPHAAPVETEPVPTAGETDDPRLAATT